MSRQAEANLAALIESTEDLLGSVDLQYRLLAFNGAFRKYIENLFGITPQIGMNPQEMLPPERAANWPRFFQRVFDSGPYRLEYLLENGRTLELAFNPILVDGKITGISVFGKDITALKAGEDSRRFMENLVQTSQDAIVAYALDGKILTWNRGAEALLGYTAQEAIGRHIASIVTPERQAYFQQTTSEIISGVGTSDREVFVISKDGRRVPFSITSWPLRNSRGEVTAISLIGRDISIRYEAERAKALLASIVESAGDAIHALDMEGTILSWNKGAENLTGYTAEEAIGKCVSMLVAPEEWVNLPARFQVIHEGKNLGPIEIVVQRKDGTRVDSSLSSSPIRNAQGVIVGASVIVRDIRQQKLLHSRLVEAEQKYRTIFHGALEGIFQTSFEGRVITANQAAATMLGFDSPEQMITSENSHRDRVWADPAESATFFDSLKANNRVHAYECRFRRADGSTLWVSLSCQYVFDTQGNPLFLEGSFQDISARKAAEAELALALNKLRVSESRYRSIFQTSPDSIAINRADDGTYLDVNDTFVATTGFSREELIGRTSIEIGVWANPEDRDRLVHALRRDSVCQNLEARFRRKTGETFHGIMSASILEIDGIPCIVSITRDISEIKAAHERIRTLAFYDTLTGVPNRQFLLDRIRRNPEPEQQTRKSRALLFIDLDNFKAINDTLGHPAGDLLLQQVAHRLTACVRDSDTVARVGSDEFAVMLESLSEGTGDAVPQARTICEKIIAELREPYYIGNHIWHCTSSIGIILFGSEPEDALEALQRAEIAMFQAKDAGRNTIRFFAPSQQAAIQARAQLDESLREAIKRRQFQLYYQPQIEGDILTGVEALLRWKHPARGIVMPGEFISLAEETGLIVPIGEWVLEAACRQIVAWATNPATAHLTVAVNVSARQIRQPDFVDGVKAVLKRTGAQPHNLRLELTESVLSHSVEDTVAKMNSLRTLGIRFSLDDFGTGYSSLSYLKILPLDRVKIDRAFVRDILDDAASGAIANTIISLARALDLPVIAEGVESEAQRNYLQGLGCNSFQGYLFSPPLPVADFEAFLARFPQR